MKIERSDLDQEIFSQVEFKQTPIISPVDFKEETIRVRSFSFTFRASLGPKPAGHLSHKSFGVPKSDQLLSIPFESSRLLSVVRWSNS